MILKITASNFHDKQFQNKGTLNIFANKILVKLTILTQKIQINLINQIYETNQIYQTNQSNLSNIFK